MSNGKTLAGSHKSFDLAALWGASSAALTSAAASICCAGPWALALLGVNGAILGAAIKPYRPFLLTAALVLLAFGYWRLMSLRKRSEGAACSIRAMRLQKTVLRIGVVTWIAAGIIGYAADQYWL